MKKQRKLLNGILITGLTVAAISAINKCIAVTSTIKDILFSSNTKTFNWRFGDIFYTKQGQGTPLLLIHDLKCTGSDYEWKYLIKDLSRSHTVYTLDLLGCGRSSKPHITYTNYLYVQLINDFIKNVIKGRTDVITSGSSSSLAIMACHVEPDCFNRLLFINPDGIEKLSKYPKSNHKTLKYLIELPVIGTFVYHMAACRYGICHDFTSKYFYDPAHVKETDVAAFYEAAHLSDPGARFIYASERSHFTNINILHALRQMNHSIFIIGGSNETGILKTFSYFKNLFRLLQLKSIN